MVTPLASAKIIFLILFFDAGMVVAKLCFMHMGKLAADYNYCPSHALRYPITNRAIPFKTIFSY
jgi:hypothetical protein